MMPGRLAVLALAAGSLAAAPVDTARMDQVVRSFASEARFMGSVLVAHGDDIVFSKGYGFANAEWAVLNTPSTKFRLGSVTKQFTAACILLLEERGKLKTGDLVRTYLSDAPPAWDKITLYNLLTHTSGIPNFTAYPDYSTIKRAPTTAEQTYRRFRDKPLDFAPGEKFVYSNSNYLLLGHLIEKITGQSYEAFLRENILKPLGMNDTGYDSRAIIPHRAMGYSPAPGAMVNADYVDMTIPHAAGALYSTAVDLLRWQRGLYGGKVLSPPELEKLITPFKGDYACGLIVNTFRGKKRFSHGGSIDGFNTALAYFPDGQWTVVALANLNGPAVHEIVEMLSTIALGGTVTLSSERKMVDVSPDILKTYAGTYELRPGFDLVVTVEDGQLMTQATGQPKIPIFAASQSTFFAKAANAEIEFVKDAPGKVTHLILRQNGRALRGTRK